MTTRRAAALVGSRIPALRTMGTVAFVAGWAALLVATTSLLVGASAPSPVGLAALALAFGLLSSAALFLILDALRVGFGSLDAFFQEALARVGQTHGADAHTLAGAGAGARPSRAAGLHRRSPVHSLRRRNRRRRDSARGARLRFSGRRAGLHRRVSAVRPYSAASSFGIPRMALVSRNSPNA